MCPSIPVSNHHHLTTMILPLLLFVSSVLSAATVSASTSSSSLSSTPLPQTTTTIDVSHGAALLEQQQPKGPFRVQARHVSSPTTLADVLKNLINTTTTQQQQLVGVDLSWNRLDDVTNNKKYRAVHTALTRWIANTTTTCCCWRFDVCGMGPAAVRAIARGVQQQSQSQSSSLHLSLCRNPVGDAGAVALAAGVLPSHRNTNITLDCTACRMGTAWIQFSCADDQTCRCLLYASLAPVLSMLLSSC